MKKTLTNEITVGFLYILPALALIALVLLYPMYNCIFLSFYYKHLLRLTKVFIGIENYLKLLTSGDWLYSLQISLVWTSSSVGLAFAMGMTAALILNQRQIRGRGLARAVSLLPWLTPTIVTAITWMWLLNDLYGLVNFILIKLHLITSPIAWFAKGNTAISALVMIWAWRMSPFIMLMLLAGLQTIPRSLYEAAKIDGASVLTEFIYITLPNLKYVIFVAAILTWIWTFNHFDIIWLLTRGGPGNSTETLAVYSYRVNFYEFNTGEASTSCFLMFLIVLIFGIIYLRNLSWEEA